MQSNPCWSCLKILVKLLLLLLKVFGCNKGVQVVILSTVDGQKIMKKRSFTVNIRLVVFLVSLFSILVLQSTKKDFHFEIIKFVSAQLRLSSSQAKRALCFASNKAAFTCWRAWLGFA